MERDNGNKIWSIVLAIVVIALLVWFGIWLWNRNDSAINETLTNETESSEVASDEQESTLAQLNDSPSNFIGQDVMVTGEVQDVLTNRIFKISNDLIGDELTVITPQALTDEQASQAEQFLLDNANVRVEGTVRQATASSIEEDYGFEIDSDIEAEFENTVVLVADSVTFTDESGASWDFGFFEDIDL